jgi:hypothetical protein
MNVSPSLLHTSVLSFTVDADLRTPFLILGRRCPLYMSKALALGWAEAPKLMLLSTSITDHQVLPLAYYDLWLPLP